MDTFNKFQEAGRKVPDYDMQPPTKSKPQKTKLRHETISLDAENFPYLKALEIGKECELHIKVKKVGERIDNDEKQKKDEVQVEILKISEPQTSNAPYKNLIEGGKKNIEA